MPLTSNWSSWIDDAIAGNINIPTMLPTAVDSPSRINNSLLPKPSLVVDTSISKIPETVGLNTKPIYNFNNLTTPSTTSPYTDLTKPIGLSPTKLSSSTEINNKMFPEPNLVTDFKQAEKPWYSNLDKVDWASLLGMAANAIAPNEWSGRLGAGIVGLRQTDEKRKAEQEERDIKRLGLQSTADYRELTNEIRMGNLDRQREGQALKEQEFLRLKSNRELNAKLHTLIPGTPEYELTENQLRMQASGKELNEFGLDLFAKPKAITPTLESYNIPGTDKYGNWNPITNDWERSADGKILETAPPPQVVPQGTAVTELGPEGTQSSKVLITKGPGMGTQAAPGAPGIPSPAKGADDREWERADKAVTEAKKAAGNITLNTTEEIAKMRNWLKADAKEQSRMKLRGMEPNFTIKSNILPKGSGQSLDIDTAKKFLGAAGGNKDKARELAKQNGWRF